MSKIRSGFLIIMLCCGAVTAAAGDSAPVRIGILTTKNNVWGENQMVGARLAVQLAAEDWGGKIGDHPIRIIEGDHQNRPKVGATIVRHWLQHGKADVILDVSNPGVANAVRPVLKEYNGLAIFTGTGFDPPQGCQNTVLIWTYDLKAMTRFGMMAFKEDGYNTAYLLNLDGRHGIGQAFEAIANAAGFQQFVTVDRRLPSPRSRQELSSEPLVTPDMPLVKDSEALVALGVSPGMLQKVAARLNGDLQGAKLGQLFCQACANLLQNQDIVALAERIYFVAPYDMEGPALTAFSARFAAKNDGKPPTPSQVGLYSATQTYLTAVNQLGKIQPAKDVAGQIKTMKINDPIFGASALNSAGIRRGGYYLYEYDPAKGALEKVAQQDTSLAAEQEGCVADATPAEKPH